MDYFIRAITIKQDWIQRDRENYNFLSKLKQIYRTFDNRDHADQFCSGHSILLSTLYRCRIIEDEARRDEDEGKRRYYVEDASFHPGDPHGESKAEALAKNIRLKIDAENSWLTSVVRSSATESSSDSHILCFSEQRSPEHHKKFGLYCVKINRPLDVFIHLTISYYSQIANKTSFSYEFRKVHYASRTNDYRISHTVPGDFLKEPKFSHENEIRMLWKPPHTNQEEALERKFLSCPILKNYCEIVSD